MQGPCWVLHSRAASLRAAAANCPTEAELCTDQHNVREGARARSAWVRVDSATLIPCGAVVQMSASCRLAQQVVDRASSSTHLPRVFAHPSFPALYSSDTNLFVGTNVRQSGTIIRKPYQACFGKESKTSRRVLTVPQRPSAPFDSEGV